jgi:hypothetical protein
MYTVSQAKIQTHNHKGRPTGIRNGWQVAEDGFVVGVVPRQEDAQWIADLVNKAVARDRQVRSWGSRFVRWLRSVTSVSKSTARSEQ